MTALITWLMGEAGKWVAGALVVVITFAATYLRGRSDARAKLRADADRAALETVKGYDDAKNSAAAGGAAWHDRLRQTRK